MDLAILGGTLVTSAGAVRAHLYVRDGRVAALSSDRLSARQEVDASGLLVLPGAVDAHVHFMDPADPSREDFPTGSAAAAVGGATTVIEHTHASPVVTPEDLRRKADYLKDRSVVDFGLAAHAWKGRLHEAPEVWRAGALYVKAFTCTTHGVPGLSYADLWDLFRGLAAVGGVSLVHAEDESLTAEAEARLRHSGRRDGGVVPEWRNRQAEQVAVAAVCVLARRTGARVVVAHASSPEVVDLARAVGGVRVESCPQYFHLLEAEVEQHGAFRKFTPPARARTEQDLEEMWRRLREGAVDYVATDHAPATRRQKQEGSIWDVHFGLPGVETTLTLLLNAAAQGQLSLERLVQVLCEVPARVYGLYPRKGALLPGSDADFVLVDPHREHVLSDERIVSKAGWTPYAGMRVRGAVVAIYVRGRMVAEEGRATAEPGWGRWVRRVESQEGGDG
jgi:dihydroorotase (multifunctional complex type)